MEVSCLSSWIHLVLISSCHVLRLRYPFKGSLPTSLLFQRNWRLREPSKCDAGGAWGRGNTVGKWPFLLLSNGLSWSVWCEAWFNLTPSSCPWRIILSMNCCWLLFLYKDANKENPSCHVDAMGCHVDDIMLCL